MPRGSALIKWRFGMSEDQKEVTEFFQELESVLRKHNITSALVVFTRETEDHVYTHSGLRMPASLSVDEAKDHLRRIASESIQVMSTTVKNLSAPGVGTAADAARVDADDDDILRRIINAKIRGYADA